LLLIGPAFWLSFPTVDSLRENPLMIPLLAIGVGPMELLIVGGVVLLLFGNRLPSVMRSMGRSVVEFKKGIHEGNELPHEVDEEGKTPSTKA
jgi:sec-independent protein translocase protein TatA